MRSRVARSALVASAMLCSASALPAPEHDWTQDDLAQLAGAVNDAAGSGLDAGRYPLPSSGAPDADVQADRAALALAHDIYEGRGLPGDAGNWHIPRGAINYGQWLDGVLRHHSIRASFAALQPGSVDYVALSQAYARCDDTIRCATLEANLDRWRRLPRAYGDRYLWVNIAAFRVDLVDHGRIVASHRTIVGKPGSPTPVFRALVTGVTANPWWSVPCAIVDESIGRLVRNHPEEARRRGYEAGVDGRGRLTVRQRPGPDNALGQIKLEMPNPWSVYLHDTNHRELFGRDERDLSHGCVRTEDPQTLGEALLTKEQGDALETAILSGVTKTFPVSPAIPVYIVYLTAESDGNGGVRYFDDIYHHDTTPPATHAGLATTLRADTTRPDPRPPAPSPDRD